jgi:hypothetical protein
LKGEFAVSISDIDNAAHLPFPVCSAIGGIVDYRAVKVPCRRTAVIKMIGRYTAENPFIFPGNLATRSAYQGTINRPSGLSTGIMITC